MGRGVIAATETYLEILSSPAHLLAELTVEVLTGCILYPLGRKLLRRHDRKVHNTG